MAKVAVSEGMIRYRKFLTVCELPVADLVWAYLQQEDVSAKMCCGSFNADREGDCTGTEWKKRSLPV